MMLQTSWRKIVLLGAIMAIQWPVGQAQFGIMKPAQTKEKHQVLEEEDPVKALIKEDPELAAALEIFAYMNDEERMEAIEELKQLIGKEANDDPDSMVLFERLIEEVEKMDKGDTSLKDLVAEDESDKAALDVIQALRSADEATFESKVLAQKEDILEAIVDAGQISEEHAKLYRSDGKAWEQMLRTIWTDLRGQAETLAQSETTDQQ